MGSPTIAGAPSGSSTVQPARFDVIAYDSRAHGESSGPPALRLLWKQDLAAWWTRLTSGPGRADGHIAWRGSGAAGSGTTPVSAVVAAETFSDLRTVAIERAPFFFTPNVIRRAFQLAEAEGRFTIDAVSPEAAARKIEAPVLIIHGSSIATRRPITRGACSRRCMVPGS